jgi:hypothetical protein
MNGTLSSSIDHHPFSSILDPRNSQSIIALFRFAFKRARRSGPTKTTNRKGDGQTARRPDVQSVQRNFSFE